MWTISFNKVKKKCFCFESKPQNIKLGFNFAKHNMIYSQEFNRLVQKGTERDMGITKSRIFDLNGSNSEIARPSPSFEESISKPLDPYMAFVEGESKLSYI